MVRDTYSKELCSNWFFMKITMFMVCTTSDKQILRTFQGFFKDKLQFTRTKIYLINWHSLTPFDHSIG